MASLATDPRYLRFHPAAESGTVNDPCGFICQDGNCHLLYQQEARWACAASSDLVTCPNSLYHLLC